MRAHERSMNMVCNVYLHYMLRLTVMKHLHIKVYREKQTYAVVLCLSNQKTLECSFSFRSQIRHYSQGQLQCIANCKNKYM